MQEVDYMGEMYTHFIKDRHLIYTSNASFRLLSKQPVVPLSYLFHIHFSGKIRLRSLLFPYPPTQVSLGRQQKEGTTPVQTPRNILYLKAHIVLIRASEKSPIAGKTQQFFHHRVAGAL